VAVSAEQIETAKDLFAELGAITTRKMMGGLCLYHDGTIFALMMSDGALYLKGSGAFIAELEAAGCTRWTYERPDKTPVSMPYWTFPDAARDDPEIACDWARRALAHL